MVTHNEMFLHALAQRLIVFDQGGVYMFEGTYQEFLDKGGWGDEAVAARTKSSDAANVAPLQISKKELRQQRSIIISERSRKLKPIDQAIEKAETAIEAEEQRLTELNEEMVQASRNQNGARIAELSPSIRQCQNLIDRNFEELEILYEKKETLQKVYDQKLKEIGET
jgi:ATP-binding cassette subfamily F protein 3